MGEGESEEDQAIMKTLDDLLVFLKGGPPPLEESRDGSDEEGSTSEGEVEIEELEKAKQEYTLMQEDFLKMLQLQEEHISEAKNRIQKLTKPQSSRISSPIRSSLPLKPNKRGKEVFILKQRVLWLKVTRSNSSPDVIASMYLNTVKDVGGCPFEMVTDLGTENGIAAVIQCYFRNNDAAHRYVPSPRNQRIEGWWSYFSRSYSTWWRNFVHVLEFRGIVDMSMELSKECLWYCFSSLIQSDLDIVKAHWNTHSIRRSCHNTVAGRPDALFYQPKLNRGVGNILLDVSQRDIRYVAENIVEVDQSNEYTEYFDMVAVTTSLSTPRTWQEALGLYNALFRAATG